MYTQDVDKIRSTVGMAALIEEHADAHGGAQRLAELLDCKLSGQQWNGLATMLSLDIIGGLSDN